MAITKNPFYYLIFICFICFISICISFLIFKKIKKAKSFTNFWLSASKEFHEFGMFGLILVDENGFVLWVNEFFIDRKINILKNNVFEWKQDLKLLQDKNDSVKIFVNSKKYEVTYLPNNRLYLFKDISDSEFMMSCLNERKLVVGNIIIDNYFSIFDNSDIFNDFFLKIKNIIFEYAKKYNLLIRKYHNDAYFVICDYAALKDMQFDKFSLIEDVRKLQSKKIPMPLTLSIGFAYNFPNFGKIDEMVDEVMNIIKNRGGDQAAVYRYGNKLIFYGGQTEAVEIRNKIPIRGYASSLINIIKKSDSILVFGHNIMDMDSIGSCLGIMSLCQYFKKECHIVYDDQSIEEKAKNAFEITFNEKISDMIVKPKIIINDINASTLVILVDCNCTSISLSPEILNKTSKLVVIDHHRQSTELFKNPPLFSYIETSAASTTELIIELINYASLTPNIVLDKQYATIMLSSIFLDSNFFKTNTTCVRTFEAVKFLIESGADKSLAVNFLKDDFKEHTLITQAMNNLKKPYDGIIFCLVDKKISDRAFAAKIADRCMNIKDVFAVFVVQRLKQNSIFVSCRSTGNINVQLLAEKLGGGGHLHASAILFQKKTVKEVETILLKTLEDFIKDKNDNIKKVI